MFLVVVVVVFLHDFYTLVSCLQLSYLAILFEFVISNNVLANLHAINLLLESQAPTGNK